MGGDGRVGDGEPSTAFSGVDLVSAAEGRAARAAAPGDDTIPANVHAVFTSIDRNGDKSISRAELIRALRTDTKLQSLLNLPSRIGDEQRDVFERVFQTMDADDDRHITCGEFAAFLRQKGGVTTYTATSVGGRRSSSATLYQPRNRSANLSIGLGGRRNSAPTQELEDATARLAPPRGQPTSVAIVGVDTSMMTSGGPAFFKIDVFAEEPEGAGHRTWSVTRRYSEFDALRRQASRTRPSA